ncbi:MAG: hypothetical protein GY799_29310 [Desulfobulbaceae bacterium]|nr:hypothetical protein [Desulfobulbaceae bacterium]
MDEFPSPKRINGRFYKKPRHPQSRSLLVSIPQERVGTIENHSPFFEIRIPFNESQDQKNGLGLNLIARFSGYIAHYYTAVNSQNVALAVSI